MVVEAGLPTDIGCLFGPPGYNGQRAGRMVMLCASEKAGIKKMYN